MKKLRKGLDKLNKLIAEDKEINLAINFTLILTSIITLTTGLALGYMMCQWV